MLDVNIFSVHILTKLFLKDFIQKDSGYILNVASSAGFMPGPLFASYYASKAYVLRLSQGIHEELRKAGRNVYIGALCPGPVDTEMCIRDSLKTLLLKCRLQTKRSQYHPRARRAPAAPFLPAPVRFF